MTTCPFLEEGTSETATVSFVVDLVAENVLGPPGPVDLTVLFVTGCAAFGADSATPFCKISSTFIFVSETWHLSLFWSLSINKDFLNN